ncbi:flavodoxin family protein [Paenalcaligenes hominis]|uniref:flavodoxin family protein n=1 Tax=Paenalcaligenes hominis TaxID=643674 RepID=UPI00352492F1
MRLLIVWHSRTSASQQLAFFAAEGAKEVLDELQLRSRCSIICLPADQVQAYDLLNASAYLFCAPENLGSLSGEMKAFFDRNYYAVLDQLNGRPYSAMISAGSSGTGAAKQLESICTGWRLQRIYPTAIVLFDAQSPAAILAPKTLSPQAIAQAKELGGLLAAQLSLQLN